MKRFGFLAVLLVSLTGLRAAVAEELWQVLFDGATLEGWKANLYPESFTVADGAIRARSVKDRVHLYYFGDGDEPVRFKDFELELIAKGEANSNSGLFFHTDDEVLDDRGHLANGYEVQLNTIPGDRWRTGSLYDVADLMAPPVDATDWFTLTLRVKGKRIVVSVNGQPVVDYTEPDDPVRAPYRAGRILRPEGGAIALQAHDAESTWYFKSIRIRRLD